MYAHRMSGPARRTRGAKKRFKGMLKCFGYSGRAAPHPTLMFGSPSQTFHSAPPPIAPLSCRMSPPPTSRCPRWAPSCGPCCGRSRTAEASSCCRVRTRAAAPHMCCLRASVAACKSPRHAPSLPHSYVRMRLQACLLSAGPAHSRCLPTGEAGGGLVKAWQKGSRRAGGCGYTGAPACCPGPGPHP